MKYKISYINSLPEFWTMMRFTNIIIKLRISWIHVMANRDIKGDFDHATAEYLEWNTGRELS